MNDDRHGDDPYKALELTQLVADLGATGLASPYTRAGLELMAQALYERGVRSRLFAPYRDTELVQFTWDPEIGGFEVTEPGVYELIMEAFEPPDIRPVDTFPRLELPRMLHRLRRTSGLRPVLAQMSEVPGHVDAVPQPIPERKLPQGVYNVIHFVQLLDFGAAGAGNKNWADRISDGRGGVRQLTHADLKAVLAEIPDVAPRYPTIWAYEQACRTIRERDARIADALTVLEQRPPDPDDQLKVIRDAHETLKLRMPRTEPATEEQKSEVARALEIAAARDEHMVTIPNRDWISATRVLAGEVEHLQTLGDTLAADIPDRCPSCDHLTSGHYEDGSGCSVTIRDVNMSADNHCPCTHDARSVHRG